MKYTEYEIWQRELARGPKPEPLWASILAFVAMLTFVAGLCLTFRGMMG